MTVLEFNSSLENIREPLFYFSGRFYKQEDDRLDLVQETLTKAFVYKDKFDLSTNFKAWIFTIMKNTFINEYRKAEKRKNVSRLDDSNIYDYNFVETTTPIEIIHQQEIEKVIESLDVKYRKPFLMHFEGFKYEEIAEEMDLPIGTVKSRIHTARKMLAKSYN